MGFCGTSEGAESKEYDRRYVVLELATLIWVKKKFKSRQKTRSRYLLGSFQNLQHASPSLYIMWKGGGGGGGVSDWTFVAFSVHF